MRAVDRLFLHPLSRASRARVVCFPYAGGTASIFNGLSRALPSDLELCAFEPPGRQKRSHEPLATSMHELVSSLLEVAGDLLDRPCVFYGHSMGSWLAFELARALRDARQALPVALLLSAARAPHLPRRRGLSQLSDEEFVAELAAMKGTPPEVLGDPDLMAYVLPRIRADFAVAERYRPESAPPLALPFTVLGGAQDHWIQPAHLQAWRSYSSAEFRLQLLAGDHFFLERQQNTLCGLLERALTA
ncbi:MAG TPA: alpha/beta fold hydrolase [Polyangiales bacterium]|nr:alpha/beta fold hydrolase [Polyangiales bacterium]